MTTSPEAGSAAPGRAAATGWTEHLVRWYFGVVWNDGDLRAFDTDLVSDDYVLHHGPTDYTVADLRPAWAEWHRAFPDLSNDIEDLIATEDRVAVRYRFSGTHCGVALGVPATGRWVETVGMAIFRVENGRLVEGWAVDDVYGLLQQLGGLA